MDHTPLAYYVLLWLSVHRLGLGIVVAVMGWVGAYVYFFKPQFSQYIHQGKPHSWSVDLVTRTAKSRGKVEG